MSMLCLQSEHLHDSRPSPIPTFSSVKYWMKVDFPAPVMPIRAITISFGLSISRQYLAFKPLHQVQAHPISKGFERGCDASFNTMVNQLIVKGTCTASR